MKPLQEEREEDEIQANDQESNDVELCEPADLSDQPCYTSNEVLVEGPTLPRQTEIVVDVQPYLLGIPIEGLPNPGDVIFVKPKSAAVPKTGEPERTAAHQDAKQMKAAFHGPVRLLVPDLGSEFLELQGEPATEDGKPAPGLRRHSAKTHRCLSHRHPGISASRRIGVNLSAFCGKCWVGPHPSLIRKLRFQIRYHNLTPTVVQNHSAQETGPVAHSYFRYR